MADDRTCEKRRKESGNTPELANGDVQIQTVIELKRSVGLASAIALNVGTMIGSGIFISPKGVLQNSGSVGLSLIVWSLCGILSMMGALCFAELGTLVPRSGGEYAYLLSAYGPLHRFVGPLPAFIHSFIHLLIVKPSAQGIMALTCAKYALTSFFEDGCGEPPELNAKLFAFAIILLVTSVNCLSAHFGARIQVAFTIAKLAAVAVLIVGGIVRLIQGYTANFTNAFAGTNTNVAEIALAFYSGLWSYDGWSTTNAVTEELINPNRDLPLCIWIALPLVTICYVLTNISYFTVMNPQQLLASPAVAVTWGNAVLKGAAFLIPISVAFSTFGSVNGSIFTGARINFATAREGHTLKILSMVNVFRFTPVPGLLFSAILAIIWLIPSNISNLTNTFSFTTWLIYGFCMVALLIMRHTKKHQHRIYKVPILFPIVVLLASLYLVLAPIIYNPRIEFLLPLGMMVLGVILYTVFVFIKFEIPGTGHMTTALQLFLQVSPSTQSED